MNRTKSKFKIIEIGKPEFRFTHWFLPVVLQFKGHNHKHEIPFNYRTEAGGVKVGDIIEL